MLVCRCFYVMFEYTPMLQLFCWVVFSTLDIRFWASPLVGFCMYALVEALSMYQSFLVHDSEDDSDVDPEEQRVALEY